MSWLRRRGARDLFGAILVVAAVFAIAGPTWAGAAPSGTIKINEVESSGGTPGDWIELVNTAASPADLGGYVLKDNDDTHAITIPAGTTIAGGGYLAFDVDQTAVYGSAAFGLGSADSARLFAPDGTLEDSYSWTAHAATTYGRCPDATGAFTTTASSTKGAPNDCPAPNFKINEIESNGGVPDDWVEIKNIGSVAGDLGGYKFRDNDPSHTPYSIPAGTIVAPGGYYVLEVAQFVFGLGAVDSATLWKPDGTTVVDSYSWTAHAATTYGRCPDGTGDFTTTASSTKGAANDCGTVLPSVKINEVESSDPNGGPDWIELVNNGATAANVGGFVLKDNDDTHAVTIPTGTTIPAAGYATFDVDSTATYGSAAFGLGSADSARLFAPDGTTLVDSYSWTAHATTTYGRCPDGTGAFTTTQAPTKGTHNLCPGDIPVSPWPGGTTISTADDVNVFGTNLSGLAYQASGTDAPGVLWAVRNGPSTLYRLVWDGTKWTPDTADGWGAGKALRYPDGTGDPDSEGVTLVGGNPANGVFVSTERNNSNNGVSLPAVLRFDVSAPGTTLVATQEWNLTPDLPGLGPNLGLEAVVWMSDAFLVSKGFVDESTGAPYNPASYPNHGTGLFFVGVEQDGRIIAYALDQSTGAYSRVATIDSKFTGVMDLEFEPETQHLWAVCDDTCNGRTETLDIEQTGPNAGHFAITNRYDRPAGMPNLNNEGFAIAPQDECVGGLKPVFWSDDNNDDGHALRAGTINCTVLVHDQTITFAAPGALTFGAAPVQLVATASSGLPVTFTATGPCTVSGTTLTATGAGDCVVTASQSGNVHYRPAPDVVQHVTIGKAPTALAETPLAIDVSARAKTFVYSAVLTSTVTGQGIAGQAIAFGPTGGATVCTAVTDGLGRATCSTPFAGNVDDLVRAGGTTARFAGDANYSASSDSEPLGR